MKCIDKVHEKECYSSLALLVVNCLTILFEHLIGPTFSSTKNNCCIIESLYFSRKWTVIHKFFVFFPLIYNLSILQNQHTGIVFDYHKTFSSQVSYPSLKDEIKIGDYYLRILLEQETTASQEDSPIRKS